MSRKILISSPTADLKSYCLEEWLENVFNLTYDNYDVHIVDNSEDSNYMKKIREEYGDRLTIERVSPSQYTSFKSALAASHEKCRQKAIKGGYDYLLHLESDIFPPLDIIERLLDAKKKIVGALYHIELGGDSKLMVQQIEKFGQAHRETYNLDQNDLTFVDGTIKKVFSCGLGCVLIHKSVFKNVSFRSEGDIVHPDSIFYADLDKKGISVHVDTSIYCKHDNKSMTRT